MDNSIFITYAQNVDQYAAKSVFQYDNGVYLYLSNIPSTAVVQTHYSIQGMQNALVCFPEYKDSHWVSKVPNALVAQPSAIQAYVYISFQDGGKTIMHITIPVKTRPKPDGYTFTEEELKNLDYVMQQLSGAIAEVEKLNEETIKSTQEANEAAQEANEAAQKVEDAVRRAEEVEQNWESSTANNALQLGNQTPDYYAKQSDYETLVSETNPQASKDAELLNGKAPEYYLPAVNLLDNPDFAVAQAGYNSLHGSVVYMADRWIDRYGTITASKADGQPLVATTADQYACFFQMIPDAVGKTVTAAIKARGNVRLCFYNIIDGSFGALAAVNSVDNGLNITTLTCDIPADAGGAAILAFPCFQDGGATNDIYYVACYDGSYTADTLPPYVPTHPRVENLKIGNPVQPRNLLDNSDWRIKANIFNQRGQTTYTSGYGIDKWVVYTSMTIEDGYLSGTSFGQRVPKSKLSGAPVTFAIKNTNGDILSCVIESPLSVTDNVYDSIFEYHGRVDGALYVGINGSGDFVWAALYEGAYTADTLPPFVSTHPRVENLKIGNAVQPRNLLDNSDWRVKDNIINQRGKDAYTSGEYCIDRWIAWGSLSINNDSISGCYINQSIPGTALRGKTVTVAVQQKSGKLLIGSATISTVVGESVSLASCEIFTKSDEIEISVRAVEETLWAALYEGIYTAETLPPYVSKGYAAELLACGVYDKGIPFFEADALTLEEINASTDLTGKIPLASAVQMLAANNMQYIRIDNGHNLMQTGVTVPSDWGVVVRVYGYNWGPTFIFDSYFLHITVGGDLYTGKQLNGATDITWTLLARA